MTEAGWLKTLNSPETQIKGRPGPVAPGTSQWRWAGRGGGVKQHRCGWLQGAKGPAITAGEAGWGLG